MKTPICWSFLWFVSWCANGWAQAEPQRLSAWLTARGVAEEEYPLGLMWVTLEELARQQGEYQALLEEPSFSPSLKHSLAALKPTGRVRQSVADANWLQAYPKKDPVVQTGDSVVVPNRPTSLRLLDSAGGVCEVPHRSGGW